MEIKAEHRVLNLEHVKQILSDARTLSLMDCFCRVKYGHCDAPVDTCIDMNEIAERNIANGVARDITLDEALNILEKTHEAGLVHMALGHGDSYEPGVANSVCSCCSCCCSILSGILRFGLASHILTSQTTSLTDLSDCNGCGVCVDICPHNAIYQVEK